MTAIQFPGLKIGPYKFTRGSWLSISLLGLGIVVPPIDITFLPEVTFWDAFTLFDTDWIVAPLKTLIEGVAQHVWDLCKGTLDSWAAAFYEKHCTYEDYVKEREQNEQAKHKAE